MTMIYNFNPGITLMQVTWDLCRLTWSFDWDWFGFQNHASVREKEIKKKELGSVIATEDKERKKN